jgi:hypothetical protein
MTTSMTDPAHTIVMVAKTHKGYLPGYLNHYGRKLGRQLYRQTRYGAATYLRSLTHEGRRLVYFRHDNLVNPAPGQ